MSPEPPQHLIERRIRILLANFQVARSQSDLQAVVLGLHSALDQALTEAIGPDSLPLSFDEKARRALPDLFGSCHVEDLSHSRNQIANPNHDLSSPEVQRICEGFVALTLDAWPRFFSTPAPIIPRPDLSAEEPAGRHPKPSYLQPEDYRSRIGNLDGRRSPASNLKLNRPRRLLAVGVLLLLPALLLLGVLFAGRDRQLSLQQSLSRLIQNGMEGDFQFANSQPPALDPSRESSSTPASIGTETGVDNLPGIQPAGIGAEPTTAAGDPPPHRGITTIAGSSDNLPGQFAPYTPAAASAEEDKRIAVGDQVRVKTNGTRLRGRDSPGLGSNVIVYFPYGALLVVSSGPVEMDGYTWLRVSGDEGEGWSATAFLEPLEG